MMQNAIINQYSVAHCSYFSCIGMAGLAVTYGLNLNTRLSRWILSFCKLENKIISIERIYQYSQIPSEAPAIMEDCRPPPSWPENGTIEIIDLKVLSSVSHFCFLYLFSVCTKKSRIIGFYSLNFLFFMSFINCLFHSLRDGIICYVIAWCTTFSI